MITYSQTEGKPEIELLSSIQALYEEIFGNIDQDKFKKRVQTSECLLTVIAWSDHKMIGFKMGYASDANTFYSWIGGVKKEHRKNGIARELMLLQHKWCAQNKFQYIRTKTMNRWRGMLILNLKNGFDIIETYTDEKKELKIVLEKRLK